MRKEVKQALASGVKRRERDYVPKAGEYATTTSFRKQVSWQTLTLAAALAEHFTFERVAEIMGLKSAGMAAKMARVGRQEAVKRAQRGGRK